MKTNPIRITLAAAAFSLACNVQAQYTLDWFKIAGGAGTVGGGDYFLDGTVGQPDAGNLTGGSYALAGGFWAGVIFSPTLSITRAGAEVVLSWEGGGFLLQCADEVNGPWADLSLGVTTDGVHYYINAPIGGSRKFFRLRAEP